MRHLRPILPTLLKASALIPALLASTAFAEEATDAAEKKGGMPQFDFTTFPSQIFWLAITFFILYVVMATMVVPRLRRIEGARLAATSGTAAEAARLRDLAAQRVAEYEQRLASARIKAEELRREAEAVSAAQRTKDLAEQAARMQAQVKDMEARLTAAKKDAMASVTATASELTGAIVEKLLGTAPSGDKLSAAVVTALADRRTAKV